ncbi:MAG: DUF4276 family protein [Balneolales bacterium]|nr:DUF4276 family protein [Balneolales bacterium]
MAAQLFISLVTEGPTDDRFLKPVIQNLFHELAYECRKEIQVEEIRLLKTLPKRLGFVAQMFAASNEAAGNGTGILCIHADADSPDSSIVFDTKFRPLFEHLDAESIADAAPQIVPVIPVRMTEAWMLADPEAWERITDIPACNFSSGSLSGSPEQISDPKHELKQTLEALQKGKGRRRKSLELDRLYQLIGQLTRLSCLRMLPSFQSFEESAREALKRTGYLR